MAKILGKLIIEFEDVANLREQLRTLLGETAVPMPAPHAGCCRTAADAQPPQRAVRPDSGFQPPIEAPRGVIGRVGDGMMVNPEPAHEKKDAQPATAAPEPPKAPEQAKAEVSPAQSAPQPGETDVTLENLADPSFPYEKLLAYCAANPKIGIDPAKCGASFMRPMVEHKIKVYLTTIT